MRPLKAFVYAALVALLSAIPHATGAQRAASIEYEFVDRPTHLPAEFRATAGTSLRFVAIKAIDGFRVDAALWRPATKAPSAKTLIISAHGSGSNFSRIPISFLGPMLAEKGYALLGINTRQHDKLVYTENLIDVRRDIEAAVHTGRSLGYGSIILHGHSLGNAHVLFYAATTWDPDIKGVLLTSAFANLPWKSRHVLVQNEDNYGQLTEAALKAVREGKHGDVLPVRMRSFTGEDVSLTAQHFLSYRLESSGTADGTYWIKRVPKPILMVRDAGDPVCLPFEPFMLLGAATAAGSLVPSIKNVLLPNAKGLNRPAHLFADNRQPLVDTITAWLADNNM